ncbi:hypothetical protein BIV57_16155 [Mangrovactinospora gilvigrisea]|uniref:Antitoxin n=1 Tax=Mangrovactinospora gilvigrisea TaxID=1428644 RepID=A0A1J7BCS6_9ACTN|nr:antitoxin [Mangrovactinospora gilvigrisea]OIV36454.1 hypothetical protein BIV57_16155 [Mangrovactinospora gilvigrisea]
MGIMDNLRKLAGKNPEQVNKGIDKAGDMADEKTGGKYSDQIDTGAQKAKEALGTDQGGAQDGDDAKS